MIIGFDLVVEQGELFVPTRAEAKVHEDYDGGEEDQELAECNQSQYEVIDENF